MKSVYRRDPRLYYGQKKTHGWVPTFQTGVFGLPVCDPQAILTAIEAKADEMVLTATAFTVGTEGKADELVSSGLAVSVDTEGKAGIKCS